MVFQPGQAISGVLDNPPDAVESRKTILKRGDVFFDCLFVML